MSSLDDEIAAARERAQDAAEQQRRYEAEKVELLRDAVVKLRSFGDEVFTLLDPVLGRIRSLFADYEDEDGDCYKAASRWRCWMVDETHVLLEDAKFGEFGPAPGRVRRSGPSVSYYEHLSFHRPLPLEAEPNLYELSRKLADAVVWYENAGRRWDDSIQLWPSATPSGPPT